MVSTPSLRGYVLEELLAWLLQRSGYSLLVSKDQDPNALCEAGNGLRVRGRGADHQVDVLGELDWPIPYSLPIRLFLEAKYRQDAVGLADVRNALGVLNDVNEHYSTAAALEAVTRPFRRYHYRYALFSASGFTTDAQQYAHTQQISLVDLDTPAFQWLLNAAARATDELQELYESATLRSFPVNQMREAFRRGLGTWTTAGDEREDVADLTPGDFDAARDRAAYSRAASTGPHLPPDGLAEIASRLLEVDGALYFGFTAAPFLLVVQPDDPASFDDLLDRDRGPEPTRLAFAGSGGTDGEWALVTGDRAVLRFGLAPFYEQSVLGEHFSDRNRGRRLDGSRTVTILGETSDVTLRFDPLPPDEAESPGLDAEHRRFRETRTDPSLSYRDERNGAFRASHRWPRAAAVQLVTRLRAENRPQAEIIVAAAHNDGFIDREDVYRIAGFPRKRTLRGFTKPAKRITSILQSSGLTPEDAAPALAAVYDHGVLATRFQVPPEFVEFAKIRPSVFD